ncbi:MAG: hypothetical protein AAF911_11505 [Planctomycetota bacterium]
MKSFLTYIFGWAVVPLAAVFLSVGCDQDHEVTVEHVFESNMVETIDDLHQSIGDPIDSISGIFVIEHFVNGSQDSSKHYFFIDRDGQSWSLLVEDGVFVGSKPAPDSSQSMADRLSIVVEEVLRDLPEASNPRSEEWIKELEKAWSEKWDE